MNRELFIVVGDIFKNIANSQYILTWSELLFYIKIKKNNSTHILLEQGISEEQYRQLCYLIKNNGLNNKISVSSYFERGKRCPAIFVHKNHNKNILIAEPLKQNEDHYTSCLMIHEDCSELSDHVTGQHLPGGLLIEAARQMTLAVTEKYFVNEASHTRICFISHTSEVKFHHYAFPFYTSINYKIIKRRGHLMPNAEFTVNIQFIQNTQELANMKYKFSVMDRNFVGEKEISLARSTTQAFLHSL